MRGLASGQRSSTLHKFSRFRGTRNKLAVPRGMQLCSLLTRISLRSRKSRMMRITFKLSIDGRPRINTIYAIGQLCKLWPDQCIIANLRLRGWQKGVLYQRTYLRNFVTFFSTRSAKTEWWCRSRCALSTKPWIAQVGVGTDKCKPSEIKGTNVYLPALSVSTGYSLSRISKCMNKIRKISS